MQTVMMLQAFTLAFLTLTGQIQMWQISRPGICPRRCERDRDHRPAGHAGGNGRQACPAQRHRLQATIFNAARVLGPLLFAPFLVAFEGGGEGWAFFLNGLSFLFVIISLFFVKTPYKVDQALKMPANLATSGENSKKGRAISCRIPF